MKYEEALKALAAFETRGKQLAEESKRLHDAKKVLGVDSHDVDRLSGPMIELAGLKETWTLLKGVFKGVSDLKDTPWPAVQTFKVTIVLSRWHSVSVHFLTLSRACKQPAAHQFAS